MTTSAKIYVDKELGPLLNTREAATELIKLISQLNCEEADLDFKRVEFMSRSFADQFHKDLLRFRNQNKVNVQLTNLKEEVLRMLQTVAKTQHKNNREFVSLPVLRFTDRELLREYLLTL